MADVKMMRLQGKDYLPVAERVWLFRQDHPDWGILTEQVAGSREDGFATFRATIMDENGRIIATAHKTEDLKGFGDFAEKAECVPLTTQILTEHGWKYQHEVSVGDIVLGYNTATQSAEWTQVLAVNIYESAAVQHISNGWGFDAICTPCHKWVLSSKTGDGAERHRLESAREFKGHKTIVTASAAPSGNSPVSAQDAAILGWLRTDGAIQRRDGGVRGVIYQSKPNRVEEIRALLRGIPHREHVAHPAGISWMPSKRYSKTLDGYRFEIHASAVRDLFKRLGIKHECEVDSVLASWPSFARQAMLDAMLAADGTEKGDFGKKRRPEVMVTFSLLCTLQGIALPRIRFVQGDFPIYRVKKTKRTYCSHVDVNDDGVRDVWCPKTGTGTWYARFDNGFVSITGNSGSVGRALSYCGYGTLDALRGYDDDGSKVVDSPQGGQRQAPQKMEARPLKTPADNLLDVLHRLYDGDFPKGHPRKVYNALNGRTIDCKDEMSDAGFRKAIAEISKNYKTKADLEMVLVSAGAFGPLDLEPEIPAVVKEV